MDLKADLHREENMHGAINFSCSLSVEVNKFLKKQA
jgi:hypothetical protein